MELCNSLFLLSHTLELIYKDIMRRKLLEVLADFFNLI